MVIGEWVTRAEAVAITGRSRRTLRRWVLAGLVRMQRADDGRAWLLCTRDLMRVEAQKQAYIDTPTFGRK